MSSDDLPKAYINSVLFQWRCWPCRSVKYTADKRVSRMLRTQSSRLTSEGGGVWKPAYPSKALEGFLGL